MNPNKHYKKSVDSTDLPAKSVQSEARQLAGFQYGKLWLPAYHLLDIALSENDRLQDFGIDTEVNLLTSEHTSELLFIGLDLQSYIHQYVEDNLKQIQIQYNQQGSSFLLYEFANWLTGESAKRKVDHVLQYNYPFLDKQSRGELVRLLDWAKKYHDRFFDTLSGGIPADKYSNIILELLSNKAGGTLMPAESMDGAGKSSQPQADYANIRAGIIYKSTDAVWLLDLTPLENLIISKRLNSILRTDFLKSFFAIHSREWSRTVPSIARGICLDMVVDPNLTPKKTAKEKQAPTRQIQGVLYEQTYIEEQQADLNFDNQQAYISRSIQKQIDSLKAKGYDQLLLELIIKNFGTDRLKQLMALGVGKPSTVSITRHYQIFFPEFDNQELKLTPLPKTVFLFFLRHPEGVLFKNLPDYRNELMDIYLKLQPTGDLAKMRHSIHDLTDPCQNSINEKCSRIKGTLLKMMTPDLARYYFVQSGRGSLKFIPISRFGKAHMVELDDDRCSNQMQYHKQNQLAAHNSPVTTMIIWEQPIIV